MECTIKLKRTNCLENRSKKAVSLEGPLSCLSLTGGKSKTTRIDGNESYPTCSVMSSDGVVAFSQDEEFNFSTVMLQVGKYFFHFESKSRPVTFNHLS